MRQTQQLPKYIASSDLIDSVERSGDIEGIDPVDQASGDIFFCGHDLRELSRAWSDANLGTAQLVSAI